ncbi:MAG: class I SAM-dependent methyltransferase [Pigmentiphaga sp.]
MQALSWCTAQGLPPPRQCIEVSDSLKADEAFRHLNEGSALLWRGDYHQARQMLSALARRLDRKPPPTGKTVTEQFHLLRQFRLQRARLLNGLLVPLDPGFRIPLRRAPDVEQACAAVYPALTEPGMVALRELLGLIGAHEWRKKGIVLPHLPQPLIPHYGVFPPTRHEYLDLVARAALDNKNSALDLGTGTGVLSLLLAQRGIPQILATDVSERALTCARENRERHGLNHVITLARQDGYPDARVDLIICNPPWLPGAAPTLLDQAVYDPKSGFLRHFLSGACAHLNPGGEAWLIMSDLAERLGLRQPGELQGWIQDAGLTVLERLDARPAHGKAKQSKDPLHLWRAQEITSLWHLGMQ